MRDYPPQVTAFVPPPTLPLRVADTRTPAAFLRWTLRRQPTVIAVSTLVGCSGSCR
ncbi:MAG: hypothetical protein R2734_07370 [Nocardioides sp.]